MAICEILAHKVSTGKKSDISYVKESWDDKMKNAAMDFIHTNLLSYFVSSINNTVIILYSKNFLGNTVIFWHNTFHFRTLR